MFIILTFLRVKGVKVSRGVTRIQVCFTVKREDRCRTLAGITLICTSLTLCYVFKTCFQTYLFQSFILHSKYACPRKSGLSTGSVLIIM